MKYIYLGHEIKINDETMKHVSSEKNKFRMGSIWKTQRHRQKRYTKMFKSGDTETLTLTAANSLKKNGNVNVGYNAARSS